MATPNNISVKIGNITLSTNDIPKKGIDLNKVDKESKKSYLVLTQIMIKSICQLVKSDMQFRYLHQKINP